MKSVLIGCALLYCLVFSVPVMANTYYLSASGNDANTGLTVSGAWQTIQKLNTISLQPGDSVLFEGGSSFSGNIYLNSNDAGTALQPVYIGSYGSARATILAGNGIGIDAYNCAGIHISNLNITGAGATVNTAKGINFFMDVQSDLSFIRIDSCNVSGFRGYGVQLGCWDTNFGYKDVRVTHVNSFSNGSGGMISYGFNDVINHKNFYVAYCTFYNNLGRADVMDTNSGNGIVLSAIDGATIEYCEAYNNGELNNNVSGGPVGMWFYLVKNGIIQYCESHHNKTGTVDGGGFDIDGGSQNCIIQYCYSHDNAGSGYLLAEFGSSVPFTGNIIRYNISQNDVRKGVSGALAFWGVNSSHRVTQSQVYNNTVYMNMSNVTGGIPAAVRLMGNSFSQVKICNNIFYTADGAVLLRADISVDSSTLHMVGNTYYSANSQPSFIWAGNVYNSLSAWKAVAPTQERRGGFQYGIQGNPLLTSPGTAGTIGLANLQQLPLYLSGYRLQQGSFALDAGLVLNVQFNVSIGARDFFGNSPFYGASQDAGAHECADCYVILAERDINFAARKQQQGVDISWQVNNESFVERYILQFSDGDHEFKDHSTINAGRGADGYMVHDDLYFVHERFYRLRIIQKNGLSIYSKVVMVQQGKGFNMQVNGNKIIFTSNEDQVVQLEFYNATGGLLHRQMMKVGRGTSQHLINKHLSAGVYIVKAITSKGISRTTRISKPAAH